MTSSRTELVAPTGAAVEPLAPVGALVEPLAPVGVAVEMVAPVGVDPHAAVEVLAAARAPFLIGVRHHSPTVARAVPELLEAASPDRVLIELPMEFAPWIEWLGHPDAHSPLALGGVVASDGSPLAFYPFADFSPELVAIRWALRHGVPVAPCDLPLAARVRSTSDPESTLEDAPTITRPRLMDRLRAGLSGRADDDMWDRLVEAGAAGSSPEQVRRAALAVGWALRLDAGTIDPIDAAREAWMRSQIAAAEGRVVAVVGAFHAPALLHDARISAPAVQAAADDDTNVVTSLIPYPFGLLDARSGYPAGIRDPQWQQQLVECDGSPAAVESMTTAFAVRVAAALRAAGHPAGPAEAREASRVAADLARLRGLPAPGRGELIEALQTVYAHGDVHGRGRAVAAVMNDVLVGERTGRLAPQTPRSGLVPAVIDLLADLRLPGPATGTGSTRTQSGNRSRRGAAGTQTIRLDPLRSPLDRRREVTLERLTACHIGYAERVETAGAAGTDTLTSVWTVGWQPSTEPTISFAGLHGITLEQAAEGVLRDQRRREVEAGGPTAQEAIAGATTAAATGVTGLLTERLSDVARSVGTSGTLTEIVDALAALDTVARGHVPGTPVPPDGIGDIIELLDAAAVREVSGLAGSDRLDDARALVAVAHRADATGRTLRLHEVIVGLASSGSPVLQGAAGAVSVLVGLADPAEFGTRIASWIDLGGDELRARLTGVLIAAGSMMTASEPLLAPVVARVEALTDAEFTRRLPGLRGGFDVLSPSARERLRLDIEHRVGRFEGATDPAVLADWIAHDQAGRTAVEALREAAVQIRPAARWRLVLGRADSDLPPVAARAATALDQLYGNGHGEGSRSISPGGGGGREAPRPSPREWADELTNLFGAEVCQEVLGEAVRRGDRGALFAIDADAARPSVELLHSVLSLAGGLPEAQLAKLRPLVARVVAELTERLRNRLQPALVGLTTSRPTRRNTGRLDLRATIAANLRSATRLPDGRTIIIPERPRFASRSKRSVDWRLILVVDVSGSMEASTIWAALTSAVLAGLPAVTTHFLTVSTRVIDLSGHADDPLSLLLEVSVGGGTHLALGLRHARSLVTVPARTMVVMVSDFEEGYPVEGLIGEVRALAESGCRLLGCASLDDRAQPRYAVGVAEQLVAAGMPVAALSPLALARWVAEQLR